MSDPKSAKVQRKNECCGAVHSSKFCPDCGKLLREDDPLDSLLSHIRKTLASKRTSAKSFPDSYAAYNIEKWETWEARILEVLEFIS